MKELSQEVIMARLDAAIECLFERDQQLFTLDVNERSISHRLALHLQDRFPGWDVDCEYNRKGHDVKRLRLCIEKSIASNDTDAKTVFPDIIVHHRVTDENLLAIEIKKTTSRVSSDADFKKLKAFKHQLGYRHALFLRFATGEEKARVDEVRWLE
jgi:hypothetical protein